MDQIQKSPHTPSSQETPPVPIQMNSPTPPDPMMIRMNSPTPPAGSAKIATPNPANRLTVPKAFKYPEMYKSPTDQIMSPVSKGLLARTKSRKSSALLPPSFTKNQHKIQASKFQDLEALKT